MIEDPDVIFVDFDDLFDAKALDSAFGPSSVNHASASIELDSSKFPETDHGFGPYSSYSQSSIDASRKQQAPMPYNFPPPPGYPHPFHAAYYYPHHHSLHPAVFYPPGSLPHHHVNPMNPYSMPSVDNSGYSQAAMAPTQQAPALPKNVCVDLTIKDEPILPSSSSAKKTIAPPPRKNSDLSLSLPSTSPKLRGKKESPSPPPPPLGDSPSTVMRDDDTVNGSAKPMTREQFYKIRPKLPRISKSDPRRNYAAAFGDAYNSCDFDKIWEFMSTYCIKDVLFVHRWVGSELYLNFPKYLEVRGIESVAEYWFSRCLVAPDLVLENKETKLYVRSDGISTVLSSFTIVCTRLYDGEVSDSIICRPAVDSDLCNGASPASATPVSVEPAVYSEPDAFFIEDSAAKPEAICNRVLDKVDRILSRVEPVPKRRPLKRKQSEDSIEEDLFSFTTTSTNSSSDALQFQGGNAGTSNSRKRMPKDQSITLLGTVTLHLNADFKIRQIELNFALQQ